MYRSSPFSCWDSEFVASGKLIYPLPLVGREGWGSGGDAQPWTQVQKPLDPHPYPSPQGGGETRGTTSASSAKPPRGSTTKGLISIDCTTSARSSAMRPSASNALTIASVSSTGDER